MKGGMVPGTGKTLAERVRGVASGEEAIPSAEPPPIAGSECWVDDDPGVVLVWRQDEQGHWWGLISAWVERERLRSRSSDKDS